MFASSIAAGADTPRLRQFDTVATSVPIIFASCVWVSFPIRRCSAASMRRRNDSWSMVTVSSETFDIMLQHAMKSATLFPMCSQHRDAIGRLGGPSEVSRKYGFKLQRVCNWQNRGVPDAVMFRNPYFARDLSDVGYPPAARFISMFIGVAENDA